MQHLQSLCKINLGQIVHKQTYTFNFAANKGQCILKLPHTRTYILQLLSTLLYSTLKGYLDSMAAWVQTHTGRDIYLEALSTILQYI